MAQLPPKQREAAQIQLRAFQEDVTLEEMARQLDKDPKKTRENFKAPNAVQENNTLGSFRGKQGGGTPIQSPSGLTYVLGVGEKGRLRVEINVKGSGAHASMPWLGTNALYRLRQVLHRIEIYEPERDTSSSLFEHLSNFAIEDKPSPENIDEIIAEVEPHQPM